MQNPDLPFSIAAFGRLAAITCRIVDIEQKKLHFQVHIKEGIAFHPKTRRDQVGWFVR
jgi:hypothetical protein